MLQMYPLHAQLTVISALQLHVLRLVLDFILVAQVIIHPLHAQLTVISALQLHVLRLKWDTIWVLHLLLPNVQQIVHGVPSLQML